MLEHGRSQIPNTLTSSLEVSHARMLAKREKESASTANAADCGRSFIESFARFDRDSSSWKTSQGCLFGGSIEFSGTWPASGTMRSGACFQVAEWVPHTCDSECSLWPTPRASDRDNCGGSNAREKAKRLGVYVGRKINPAFQESLMGFPIGWTDVKDLEMPLTQELPNGSADESLKRQGV
jgi:hypothetical protein